MDRSTCKVVLRLDQRGARIYPRGCKVRSRVDTAGQKKRYSKTGTVKLTKVSLTRRLFVNIKAGGGNDALPALPSSCIPFIWNTGAPDTHMCRADADLLGITAPAYGEPLQTATGKLVPGQSMPAQQYDDIPLQSVGESATGPAAFGSVIVIPGVRTHVSNLIGSDHNTTFWKMV